MLLLLLLQDRQLTCLSAGCRAPLGTPRRPCACRLEGGWCVCWSAQWRMLTLTYSSKARGVLCYVLPVPVVS
eukprot:scaffold1621_cov350-Prasinococcus_capsulatus_cf.AAC.14